MSLSSSSTDFLASHAFSSRRCLAPDYEVLCTDCAVYWAQKLPVKNTVVLLLIDEGLHEHIIFIFQQCLRVWVLENRRIHAQTQMWLTDVAYGALTPGINAPTVAVLNVAILGCIGCLAFLLVNAITTSSWLLPHAAFLLVLAIGLLISVNWFVFQLGTVSSVEQQRQLFEQQAPETGRDDKPSADTLDNAQDKKLE